jgi:hypothetical protein
MRNVISESSDRFDAEAVAAEAPSAIHKPQQSRTRRIKTNQILKILRALLKPILCNPTPCPASSG